MNIKRLVVAGLLAITLGLTGCVAQSNSPETEDEHEAAETIQAGGAVTVFYSATIILREGLEAVLIIGVILGYMKATHRDPKYAKLIYMGVGVGILLSLLTWAASLGILSITHTGKEMLEGITSLITVAVLFYTTNWLFHKAYVVDWMAFIKEESGRAMAAGSLLGLIALGFTVVYREGFETVLFYQTMLFNTDAASVLTGFVGGSVILIGLAYAILKLSVRLPIRPFFSITGGLLLLMAFRFTGMGIHALQEAGIFGESRLSFIPAHDLLKEILGVYPYLETLLAQVILLAVTGLTFVISRWQWKRAGLAETS